MKPAWPLKTILLLFAVAATFYLIAFYTIEHFRTRSGPWEVTFSQDTSNNSILRIDQPALAITNVQIQFLNALPPTSFVEKTIRFGKPRPVPHPLPFGECLFMDTTVQPGTVVIQAFGHEVQLLPRVLTIDRRELPWKTNSLSTIITLEPLTNSIPSVSELPTF